MSKILKVRKRDGSLEDFNSEKIKIAIEKAYLEVRKEKDKKSIDKTKQLASQVIDVLEKIYGSNVIPTVEEIQDIVEELLIKNKFIDVAKAFILYREEHKEVREFKTFLGVRDDLKLSTNAIKVLAKRYLLRNEQGNIIETPRQLFQRVAKAIALVDLNYKKSSVKKTEEEFFNMLSNLEFLPNSPTLMNANTNLNLAACFVLPVEDSLKGIFRTIENMAIIQQSGGGTGFNFSRLRPKGDFVKSTKGVASGPVSFIKVFDAATETMKQGSKRRGANMGILDVTHPDVIDFITSKTKEDMLTNFNISVGVSDLFMDAVEKNKTYEIVNPRTRKIVGKKSAKEVFDLIVAAAWQTGDPGLVFLDEINRHNPTPFVGRIESTNPCGEMPLLPYESCNLGSIDLSKMFVNEKFSWDKLKKTIHLAVHFLDNVIDANKYMIPETEQITKANRKIGLGIMGFAEALIKLEISYDSDKALDFAEKLMKFINDEAHKASEQLAQERGSFSNFAKSILAKKYKAHRNATVTTIAPTGTISIIANTTSGIEPLFAVSFVREVMEGTRLLEVNSEFEKIAKEKGFYSRALIMKIAKHGSVQDIKEVPRDVKKLFVTALDIAPEWHVKMQAVFQKYTDNAVSKTINLPENASIDDVRRAYLLAYKLKCKGITVYRYGCKKEQVLYLSKQPEDHVRVSSEFSGGCPGTVCD